MVPPLFSVPGGNIRVVLTSDSPALVGSNVTFVVKLVFPRGQKEDDGGSIVYEKNCRNGKECYSHHGNSLVLQATGYGSSSPELLETHLRNLNAHRYFCKCKMLLSYYVTLSSSWMTVRVSVCFHPVPSSPSTLANATSANWWFCTAWDPFQKLYCHTQLCFSG